MFRKLNLIPALCAFALAGTLQAQTTTIPEGSKPVARADVPVSARMGMHVSAMVLEEIKKFVPDDDKRGALFLRMSILAKQEAAAASCAAFELDQPRMVSVMMRTLRVLSDGTQSDLATAHLNRALRHYNTLLGGELAQFAYEPTSYCNAAGDFYNDLSEYPTEDSMLVLKLAT
ncbi:hypothetical protein J3454_06395 [Erythrobacter sp. NFXS35]|uniref:hypothetical protein n=1 Tax=Erythrobacter sp. NFXS35 TaxID=2818436 RepID=UPI0032DFF2AD